MGVGALGRDHSARKGVKKMFSDSIETVVGSHWEPTKRRFKRVSSVLWEFHLKKKNVTAGSRKGKTSFIPKDRLPIREKRLLTVEGK